MKPAAKRRMIKAGLVLALAPVALQAYPWLYWQAPEQLHAWLTPAPRGPPTHT